MIWTLVWIVLGIIVLIILLRVLFGLIQNMMDKFIERLIETAAAAYMPRLESMGDARREELLEVKSKIKTNPREVEDWFDKEIEKLDKMNVADMLTKIK